MNTEKRETRRSNPRASSNFLSSLFLCYMVPIFYQSYKKEMTEEDLFEPLNEHRSKIVGDTLEATWNRYRKKHNKWALHFALARIFGMEFLLIGLLTLFKELSLIVINPYLIGKLVAYFAQTTDEITHEEAFYFAVGLIISMLVELIIAHPSMMWTMHLTMKMRVSCSALIYRKTLKLSQDALGQTTIGHVINLLSNDVGKFDQGFVLAHYSWVAPIQCIVAIYILYRQLGVACFVGVAFLMIFLPIQMLMAKRTSVLSLRTALRTDERVRLMNEIISGIQVIKMYTWEKPFAKLVAGTRCKEMKAIRANKILTALAFSIELFASRAAICISLISCYLMGIMVTAEIAYGITNIFDILKACMTYLFTLSVTSVAEVNVSILRIKKFLELEELPKPLIMTPEATKVNGTATDNVAINNPLRESSRVILQNINARWNIDSSDDTLKNINFEINQPQLFAIIGPVGSGKSSLLNVILSELPISSGELEVVGKMSYASQEPWIFSASARQNILFGDDFDEERYRRVVKVCALESDFAQFPFGDKTLVGEKGKVLSGGQRARINLARAIYKKADIYLLDDPLSAVDTHVGKKLYNECIRGFLATKICILITHQLQYLTNAETILILNNGQMSGLGTYNELQNSGLDFAKLLEEFHNPDNDVAETRKIKTRQISVNSESEDVTLKNDDDGEGDEPMLEKEKLTTGAIKFSAYKQYFRAGGNYFTIFSLVMAFLLFEVISRACDYYISLWVNTEQYFIDNNITETEQNATRKILIYEYAGITVGTIVMAVIHNLFIFIFLVKASINLHNYIFAQLAAAKMKFFNSNPVGRILNRFSKDIGTIDDYLPTIIADVIGISIMLLGTIVLTSIVNPVLLPSAIVLMFVLYLLRSISLRTNRNVKRIEGITRNPMFSQVTTTMNGLSTIRAFSAETILVKEFDGYQDNHSSAWYFFIASTRAMGFWMDLSCAIFISLIIIAMLLANREMYGGDLGLIITQYMGLMGKLQWCFRQWSNLEVQMTSVERVLEYTKLENEPKRQKNVNVPKNWPDQGKLEFRNVSIRYLENDPPVLKHINFKICPGEKVGIVGRTGAGKSSIIVSLFQLYELEGAILIDDIDTTKLSLDLVRSKVSIIPQEPILFSGTMRRNLDPFDEFSDDILWNALEQVELKEVIAEMSLGLHTNISEGGSNYSIGQRQLVCLARAIIRNNCILVLDEATANVDPHTDELIQKTIRKRFADCTVLTIAHRLHTVMDSDKILVMDSGRVVEFDSPYILLQKSNGIFKGLVEATGTTSSKNLKEIAKNIHNSSKII